MYHDLSTLHEVSYTGFLTVEQLWKDYSAIPKERGVYLVLTPDCTAKTFLAKGVGGYFKGKDPNVPIEVLDSKWVNDCHLLYIGKAGGDGSSATLNSRLKQYLEFGRGKPIGHYGGRFIWQLANHSSLLICWRPTPLLNPRAIEQEMLNEFTEFYGKLPFANLVL